MKKTVLFIAVLLIFSFGTAFGSDIWFDVKCPATVNAGAVLNATVDAYASDGICQGGSVSVGRLMVGIGGNGANTLGNIGLWGPYLRTPSPAWSIPVCSQTPLTRTVKIIDSVPASLANTMAMVVVQAIDSAGRERAGGSCLVKVNQVQ